MQKVEQAISIYVRMRPRLMEFEDEDSWRVDKYNIQLCSIPRDIQQRDQPSDMSMVRRRYADAYYNYNFKFDNVFSPEDSTEVVYEQSCRQLIQNVLQGYNATIFLYGQTTSGKTYTMLGNDTSPGIIPFTLLDIFREAEQLTGELKLSVSYLEIYNEQINDLLNPGSSNLKIHEDQKGYPVITQLKQCPVNHFNEAITLLRLGEEHRCYREKSEHEHSSRSHTIFQIKLERREDRQKYSAVLNLVDLAGSERLSEDEVSRADTNVTEETGYINKSLFILSNVINKLAEGKKYIQTLYSYDRSTHIPYRDSKLTRFLSNSLGGNSLTTIICTVSPAAMNFYQTLSTLRFATRAKKVHNKVGLNATTDPKNKTIEAYELLLQEKQQELEQLRRDKDTLTQQLKDNPSIPVDETCKIEVYASYLQLMIKNQQGSSDQSSTTNSKLQDFQASSAVVCADYKQDLNQLIEEYQNKLAQLAQKHIDKQDMQEISIPQFQKRISCEIDSEQIFNEIYVNAILNPTNELIFEDQAFSTTQMTTMLQNAYTEAMCSLQGRLNEYTKMSETAHKAFVMQSSSKLSEADTNTLQQIMLDIDNSVNWVQDCKDRLSEQYKRKVIVLEQAFVDVEQKILQSERDHLKEQRQSEVDAAIQPPKSMHHLHTPKFQQNQANKRSNNNQIYVWGSGKDGRLGNVFSQNIQLTQMQDLSIKLPTALVDLQVQFQFIACGYYHTAAVTQNGQLFTWGKGNQGQLGLGSFENSKQPTICRSLKDKIIIQVSCGCQHSMCLTELGQLFSWGSGEEGQLGTGQKKGNSVSPLMVQIDPIGYIACGHSSSAAITSSGLLYTWGSNLDGRLMLDNRVNQSTPQQSVIQNHVEPYNSYVKRVAMGVNHTVVVTSDGIIFTAGSGSHGQLGIKPSPDGTPLFSNLHKLEFDEKAVEVACGEEFSLVLSDKGDIYSFGKKSNGTLGHTMSLLPDCLWQPKKIETLRKIKMISAGKRHSAAITQNGEVYCWGFNFYDQLGISGQMRFVDEYQYILKNRPVKLELPPQVIQIACGEFHTVALIEK